MSITEDLPPPTFGMSTGVDEEYQDRCDVTQQRLQPEYETAMTMDVTDKHMEPDPVGPLAGPGPSQQPIDQHIPGAKNDQDKMDLSLLQLLPNAIMEICRVMDYGQTKYTRGGFLEVPDAPRRYTSAMQRHWFKELFEKFDSGDPFYDTEAGRPFKGTIRHDAQVAVNALFRLECTMIEELKDEALIEQADNYIQDVAADDYFNTTTFGELKDAKTK